jgi:hypothetical protein
MRGRLFCTIKMMFADEMPCASQPRALFFCAAQGQ